MLIIMPPILQPGLLVLLQLKPQLKVVGVSMMVGGMLELLAKLILPKVLLMMMLLLMLQSQLLVEVICN